MSRPAGDPYLAVKQSFDWFWRPYVYFNTPTCYVQVWWFRLWVGVYKPTKPW